MMRSWLGVTIGRPDAGERMLLALSMSTRASAWASADSGRCTAIWSPSKSALKAVQTGRPVQEDRVLLDDLLQHVPNLRASAFHHPLGRLDVLGQLQVHQPLH